MISIFSMSAGYQRKKPKVSEEVLEKAIKAVRSGNPTNRIAALYDIAPSTLRDRLKKKTNFNCHGNQVRQISCCILNLSN